MRTLLRPALVAAATITALTLTGCSSSTSPHRTAAPGSTSTNTAIPIPTVPPELDTEPIAAGSTDGIYVDVYNAGQYTSSKDCKCALRDESLGVDVPDLFPRGSTVWMLRIAVHESWGGTVNIDRAKLTGQFADRPEAGVIDTIEGPTKASTLAMPWMPEGLVKARGSSEISGDTPASFLVAFRVPDGSTRLNLSFDVPTAAAPNELEVPVPAAVQQAAHDTNGVLR